VVNADTEGAMNKVLLARSELSRRHLMAGGVAAAGLWSAPSVLSLDRVGAAVGSCGIKPRQVDFTRWLGALLPGAFTSDDGSVAITATTSDPWGVQDATWATRVYNGTLNSRDNPVITGMRNARRGRGITITFTFSLPVAPSFFLVDIDRAVGSWEDTVQVTGSIGGGAPFAPTSMATGGANAFLPPDTVRGTSSTSTAAGNVEVDFSSLVDTITIAHSDVTNWTQFQWIGIHDLHWC
jgi:hypothetical protein